MATLAMFAEPASSACMAALPDVTLTKLGVIPCLVKKPSLSATYSDRLAKLPSNEVMVTLTGAAVLPPGEEEEDVVASGEAGVVLPGDDDPPELEQALSATPAST